MEHCGSTYSFIIRRRPIAQGCQRGVGLWGGIVLCVLPCCKWQVRVSLLQDQYCLEESALQVAELVMRVMHLLALRSCWEQVHFCVASPSCKVWMCLVRALVHNLSLDWIFRCFMISSSPRALLCPLIVCIHLKLQNTCLFRAGRFFIQILTPSDFLYFPCNCCLGC